MSYRQKERLKEMIVLPVWAMICLCLPHVAFSVLFIIVGIVGLWDHREAYKDELRAELEAELSPIERAFRSGRKEVEELNLELKKLRHPIIIDFDEAMFGKKVATEEIDKPAVENDEAEKPFDDGYIPVCPRGYDDCVWDPARIEHLNPAWYKTVYGDLSPEDAIHVPNGCFDRYQRDPNEEYYCWDDEEK